jgi:tRNA (adenine57-N1/adenine58-N1)-methyltransferase
MTQEAIKGDFRPGDPMLLVDERDRHYLLIVPESPRAERIRGEVFTEEVLCAQHDGGLLASPIRRRYLVFKPTLQQIVMNMPRSAQVIYPKDLATIMEWGDVAPGLKVAEVGCGHGALTMTLLRALGPEGKLDTYDVRKDHLNRTRKNAALYLGPEVLERWQPIMADPSEAGFSDTGYDRLFTDVPEPWTMVETAAAALIPGAMWLAYIPGVMQMSQLIEALNLNPFFCMAEGFETLQRFWHIKGRSIRPKHSMKAHTGFIVTGRRRWREDVAPKSDNEA